jgi:hypothetical protein
LGQMENDHIRKVTAYLRSVDSVPASNDKCITIA